MNTKKRILMLVIPLCLIALGFFIKPQMVMGGDYCDEWSTEPYCKCPDEIMWGCCSRKCMNYEFLPNPVCWDAPGCYETGKCAGQCCKSTCKSGCKLDDCPTGYTKDPDETGILCRTQYTSSVSCKNEGGSCPPSVGCGGDERICYLLETNVSFKQIDGTPGGSTSGPSAVSIKVDGKPYELSTDPENPTHIKLPTKGPSNVQISVPTFTAPAATTRGAGYYFMANNFGLNNEWGTPQHWTSCTGVTGEDFCKDGGENNEISFNPSSLPLASVLKEGAVGEISANYYTINKCDDGKQSSVARLGYYVVDYIPDPPDPCTPGDATCPWIPEITTNTTQRGCSSLTYSGTEANNELSIKAKVTDTDNVNEIEAFTLWFSKDINIPVTGTIAASYTGSIISDLGIMIRKSGSNWDTPNIYATNSNFGWGQISLNSNGEGYINVAGTNIIEISEISVFQNTEVTFDYKIRFIDTPSNLSGMYNVYGGSLDSHMINDNLLDQSYYYKFFNWGIDLVNPTVEEIQQQVQDPTSTNVTWINTDAASGIGKTLINGYRIGGLVFDQATLYDKNEISKGAITLSSTIPSDSEIGLYNDSNAWQFINNTGETDRLNIQTNERGEIALYVTAYDKACNTNGKGTNVDLDPWFATRGATVYSNGNISTSAKLVAGLPYLDGVFNPRTGMDSDLIDIGTELLSSRNTFISRLVKSGSGAAFATEIEDSNNVKSTWYTKLLKKFSKYKPELTELTSVSEPCTTGKCYFYSTENITIPKGYTCNNPILFISEKDIHINPNVQSDNSVLSGCIFLAKNNIYVDAGTFQSSTGSVVKYDYIEGFLIAENQIIFPVADETLDLRDGVEIFGGMVALGTSPASGESAISIKRNLRLYSQINPTVVLTYDNKYSSLSTMFFGIEYNLYKQEVGFKTF